MSGVNNKIETTVTCKICKAEHIVVMPKAGYDNWQRGARVQDALPQLSVNDRELLISGICGTCFDALFED